ncbi:MAG: LysR family transcriptional regulator [Phenylobacterium sp.]|nr:LysR family transcriptional regulator [Phenylobacterium sp.]
MSCESPSLGEDRNVPVRPPSLRAIAAFEAAARHESFTKAADELNLTQSAISHAIRSLELRLGVDLFDRFGRTVVLTESGRAFVSRLRLSLNLISEAFEAPARPGRARLVVAATAGIAERILANRLPAYFSGRQPRPRDRTAHGHGRGRGQRRRSRRRGAYGAAPARSHPAPARGRGVVPRRGWRPTCRGYFPEDLRAALIHQPNTLAPVAGERPADARDASPPTVCWRRSSWRATAPASAWPAACWCATTWRWPPRAPVRRRGEPARGLHRV